ncbi:DUF2637 domain-containing protein [Catenulispora pinisilvae]|uniref:DUF2637 domain-containing protein n=1 Tax=Catenulispora pinisilvae TaxID=2705253 RepID=UPI001890B75A|nr:DUF2637 domain-containing protein [Catenulispora pinisilvae]
MSHQNTAWLVHRTAPSDAPTTRTPNTPQPPAWITNGLLTLSGVVLFALACASAWLSYHAQLVYVLAHNGDLAAEARVWALLLDAGTAGVSLLRLYETLQGRRNVASRISLLGCITASVAMNLLHTPSHSLGGYLVAAVPPVMYAVFLEHLLTNLRDVLVRDEAQRSMWRTSTLWVNFPRLMWSRRRAVLRHEAEGAQSTTESASRADDVSQRATSDAEEEAQQGTDAEGAPRAKASALAFRRGRGPGPKRVAFEAALKDQVRSGDLRLFSEDERERNAAAYQAAASLPAPLSRGTARRYVVQALPRLNKSGALYELPVPASSTKSG